MKKTLLTLLALAPTSVLAAPLVDPNAEPATTADAITQLIENLQNIILGAAGAIAVTMIIYGSIVLITGGGNEDRVAKGKKILTYAIGGAIFIIASYTLITIFIKLLGGNVN